MLILQLTEKCAIVKNFKGKINLVKPDPIQTYNN